MICSTNFTVKVLTADPAGCAFLVKESEIFKGIESENPLIGAVNPKKCIDTEEKQLYTTEFCR